MLEQQREGLLSHFISGRAVVAERTDERIGGIGGIEANDLCRNIRNVGSHVVRVDRLHKIIHELLIVLQLDGTCEARARAVVDISNHFLGAFAICLLERRPIGLSAGPDEKAGAGRILSGGLDAALVVVIRVSSVEGIVGNHLLVEFPGVDMLSLEFITGAAVLAEGNRAESASQIDLELLLGKPIEHMLWGSR